MSDSSIEPDTQASSFDAKAFLASVSQKPGVYQMINAENQVLYVGKAKNLFKRLSSYFSNRGLSSKTIHLVNQIHHIDISITANEVDALILEQRLIKEHMPMYNVLLKDDKSYPYILVSKHKHPRLAFHRGPQKSTVKKSNSRSKRGDYFGPFPNSSAVKDSLNLLQKVFKVRQCEDSYYANRSRPCLQYQINRCLAPCCIDDDEKYQQAVKYTVEFLQGKSSQVVQSLADQMEQCSNNLEFEQAAELRDQIQQLQYVQSKQGFENEGSRTSCDVLALEQEGSSCCAHALYIRQGRVIGSRAHYFKSPLEQSPEKILADFIAQKYLHQQMLPPKIFLSHSLNDAEQLAQALSADQKQSLSITGDVRGQQSKWLDMAKQNARENLTLRLSINTRMRKRFDALQSLLDLDNPPKRFECFDISHHGGQQTFASCVVFSQKGAEKKQYRLFKIKDVQASDDYAAIKQAVFRRYNRLIKENQSLPDIVFIDGGKGQLSSAYQSFCELGLDASNIVLVGIAKGPSRKAGFEILHFVDGREVRLDVRSPALHLIQQIRDESHRFAQKAHTQAKRKSQRSILEEVEGVGEKRRRDILRHFGGLQQVQDASLEELQQVPGINQKIAQAIYQRLHPER